MEVPIATEVGAAAGAVVDLGAVVSVVVDSAVVGVDLVAVEHRVVGNGVCHESNE